MHDADPGDLEYDPLDRILLDLLEKRGQDRRKKGKIEMG
jgi:hypothetical protein